MKTIILAVLLSIVAGHALAAVEGTDPYRYYYGAEFPDESSTDGLPAAIPCVRHDKGYLGFLTQDIIECRWMDSERNLSEWSAEEGRRVIYPNRRHGRCIKGKCLVQGNLVGWWDENRAISISIWYYVASSTDGKPVAYLNNTGPGYDGDGVSYVEAGKLLWDFQGDYGVVDAKREVVFERLYEGGYAQFQKDLGGDTQTSNPDGLVTAEIGKVVTARCNPQLDDECYINDIKVPVDNLKDYLPIITDADVTAQGGHCEYPICYNGLDSPIGVLN